MRVASVVGARPQFVKAALLSREFATQGIEEHVIHTGQHYDASMSDAFFEDLELPEPAVNLRVGSASHGVQTGQMLQRLEPVLTRVAPDCVLVYGDTNSTLAGALAAAKLGLPVAHVEAGLRSFDRSMPEEINRLVADRIADLLLAPGELAARQLEREGIDRPIEIVGDLMVDLAIRTAAALPPLPAIMERLRIEPLGYALATIHRAANTADQSVFERLLAGLRGAGVPVIFPVHPRTRALAERLHANGDGLTLCQPLRYREIIALQKHARVVLTDSGGMQKESVVLGTPCVTLRDRTEWPETLEGGWNVLAGDEPRRIAAAAQRPRPAKRIMPFGGGQSARRIVDALNTHLGVAPVPCAS
jgi:UDP-N-acetylglucosamine 2-epimerase